MILCAIGRVRGLALLNHLWTIAEDWHLPIALGKSQYGTDVTLIGYRFLTRSHRFMLTENKVHLLKKWFERLRALRGHRVEIAEFASLAGQLVWARAALPMSGRFIRRIFALANRPEKSVYQPKWLRFDLDSIEDALDADKGAMMITRAPLPSPSHPTSVAWSDACRELDGAFSGAGGFSPKGGGLLWWYQFKPKHVQTLPIHVLEAVAEVVNLAFVATATKDDNPKGGEADCVQFCDNMAWVAAVDRGKPTDPRLREVLQIRHDLQARHQLRAHIAYVNTHTNTVADLASRGEPKQALEELRRHGWDSANVRTIDLNANPELGPLDLDLLLDRAVQLTVGRAKDRARKRRAHGKGKERA